MGVEIERKFLVRGETWKSFPSEPYCQGYLNRDPLRTIRIRTTPTAAYVTIKGATHGSSRAEFEYRIPFDDAKQLLELCDRPWIEKRRHRVPHAGLTWEVDEFLGANQGLVIAEVELQHEQQSIEIPEWVGEEVTGDVRYQNSRLVDTPYSQW